MSELIVPQDACEHPIDELRCDLRSPKGDTDPAHVRLFAQCLQCKAQWTEYTLPDPVIDKLQALLDAGQIRQGRQ